jgi:membrane protease YdiL (CAAX protease family)
MDKRLPRARHLIINESEQRPRAGWRLLAFAIIFMLLNAVVSILLRFAFGGPTKDKTWATVLLGIFLVITATSAVYLCRRYFDKKSFSSLGLQTTRASVADLFFGFFLSGLMIALIFLAFIAFGWIKFEDIAWPSAGAVDWAKLFLLFIGVGATVGWWEELVFRGYLLQNLKEGLGLRWAIGLSCLLYGVIHLLNPNARLLSAVIIALIGYLRIFGWLRTGQLWLSMGMHAGWNFFQGPIFGFAVSGRETFTLLNYESAGPDWITGGTFGPEAGLIAVPPVLFGLLAMLLWTQKRIDRVVA